MRDILIGSRHIGPGHPPFIVAEMSGNHNQSLERALEIADAAAECGAHALKLQTYTADTMTLDLEEGEFLVGEAGTLWKGQSLHRLYRQAYTPWEWHKPILERCNRKGMICFSTPFDETALEFLESLDVPCYKVASFENTHIPLIRKIAATGKPLIISTGMAQVGELDETVRVARASGCREIILLKCTSTYPASPEHSNLLTIPHMRQLFGVQVGLSDHTPGIGTAIAAVALGASVIEKHFTLRRSDGGVDAAFSLEPSELRALVQEAARAAQALGEVFYGPTEQEKKSMVFRRSLYVTRNLKAGDILTGENVRAIRPGLGLPPKYLDLVLGMPVREDVKRGTPLDWKILFGEGKP